MKKRALGRTGVELSVVGFGGIGVMNTEPPEAARHVSEAVDRGVNYFDVAPSYGNAEQCLGPALEPYRKDAFLACKTGRRDAEGAREELAGSLERLRTDHFDLYQLHAISKVEDVEKASAPGGVLEVLAEAKRSGRTRFVGFSAHSEEAALMLLDRFEFDSVLYPVNFACWSLGGFGARLLAKIKELGIGALALKSLAKRPWREGEHRAWPKCWYKPIDDLAEATRALSFTLGRGITAAVSPGHAELCQLACDAAENLTELDETGASEFAAQSGAEPIFKSES